MPSKSANVKNEKQYEALKDKGMSKQRAAKIANSEGASKRGGKSSGKGGDSSQGGTSDPELQQRLVDYAAGLAETAHAKGDVVRQATRSSGNKVGF